MISLGFGNRSIRLSILSGYVLDAELFKEHARAGLLLKYGLAVFRPTLLHLADRIGSRFRAKSRPGRTVTVRVRFANLNSVTRSVPLDAPISATVILAELAEELEDRERTHAQHLKAGQYDEADALHGSVPECPKTSQI